MIFFLLLSILMIVSGAVVLLKSEVRMSNVYLLKAAPLSWWASKQMAGNDESEKDFMIRGFAKNLVGLVILVGGIGFLYFALLLR